MELSDEVISAGGEMMKRFSSGREGELSGRPDSRDERRLDGANLGDSRPSAGRRSMGGGRLERIDDKRIEEAVVWIRTKVAATLRRGAQDVGNYLLDSFFRGDAMLAGLRNPHKEASYRALAERCGTAELPVSKTWLNNAVGIAVMLRRLPVSSGAFKTLPSSYQEALLPLRDPAKVESVAKRAALSELSYREVRQLVAEERTKAARGASERQRSLPRIVKTLNRSEEALGLGEAGACFSKADVEELSEEQRETARASAQKLIRKLRALLVELG